VCCQEGGSSAVENGPVTDVKDEAGEAGVECETEQNVESTTREPSLPPSTAG